MDHLELIGYQIINEDGTLPPMGKNNLYAYVLAGNGIFIRAERPGLKVLLAIDDSLVIGNLPSVIPYVGLDEFVPVSLLESALIHAYRSLPNEDMFWFSHQGLWCMTIPPQSSNRLHVVPLDEFNPDGTSALIDLHSHGRTGAFFSAIDDKDEKGFRIYAVIGSLQEMNPEIIVRVGIYGQYFEIPAKLVFEMPPFLMDLNEY